MIAYNVVQNNLEKLKLEKMKEILPQYLDLTKDMDIKKSPIITHHTGREILELQPKLINSLNIKNKKKTILLNCWIFL